MSHSIITSRSTLFFAHSHYQAIESCPNIASLPYLFAKKLISPRVRVSQGRQERKRAAIAIVICGGIETGRSAYVGAPFDLVGREDGESEDVWVV